MLATDPIYRPENIALFEAIYGKNLISLGGLDAVDNMFSDLNLKDLKILDLGFGLAGVAFYLAKKYQIEVLGIEIHPWMVDYANTHAPEDITSLVKFTTYDQAGKIPYKTAAFDLVYSKGVLNHVKEKGVLFPQVNRVLKANGLFVIADWIYLETTMNDSSPLVHETKESYQHALEKSGFKEVSFRNDSMIFLDYVKKLLENLMTQQEKIEKMYGKEIFSTIWQDHHTLIKEINQQRKFAMRIIAKK